MKRVGVIGSGFAGLSCSAFLAKAGFEVTVFEQHSKPGGRARVYHDQGFIFDMGPSWYWMPDVFERFYNSFGYNTFDFYRLKRLDPSYTIHFQDETIEVAAEWERLKSTFEQIEPGSGEKLEKFIAEAEVKYNIGIMDFVYKPSLSAIEFMNKKTIRNSFKLDLFSSFSKHVRKYFYHPKLIELLEFPVLFLGAKPSETPALYSLMNYADLKLGTWYPMGSMNKIVQAMYAICKEQGVAFKFNSEVKSIHIQNGQAHGIETNEGNHALDIVISAADYHHTETQLIAPPYRSYTDKYWETRTMAPSSVIFYLGVNKNIPGLTHHNLFFDADFKQHAKHIYDTQSWPEKPLFYVCAPSKTDKQVAPEGMENLFVLIPTAPGLADNEKILAQYYEHILSRMEQKLQTNIRDHVISKKAFAASNFIAEYNSFKGNAYGLANTLNQTAFFKPAIKSKKVSNLYYTGQLTVPGPGVPPAIISGEVVANQVIKENKPSYESKSAI